MPAARRFTKIRTLGATLPPLAIAAVFFWLALGAGSLAHEPEADKPFLGVMLTEETEYDEGGARVAGVIGDSAAEQAGLEKGDIIVGFDGRTIRGPGGLTRAIRDHEVGDRVEIVVVRDGAERSFDVELGARKSHFSFVMPEDLGERIRIGLEGLEGLEDLEHHFDFHFSECEDDDCRHHVFSWSNRPRLGVQLTDTTPELRRHFGADEETGMLVTRVLPDTPAEEGGIRVGDLIVAVDGEPVDSAADIRRAIREKDGQRVEVEVIRDGRSERIDVSLPEIEEHDDKGAHSLRLAPGGGVHTEVSRAVRAAMAEARQASREIARARRGALREAMRVQREAAREARRAMAWRAGSVL